MIIGFSPIYNEADCIIGWYNNMKVLADRIYALVDPRGNDNTLEILSKIAVQDKKLNIVIQDLTLGDSTRNMKGKTEQITYLHNVNVLLGEIAHKYPNAWCLWLAADERIHPRHKPFIDEILSMWDIWEYDAIRFELYDIVEGWDSFYRKGWDWANIRLMHRKIFRPKNIRFGTTPHSGSKGWKPGGMIRTDIPFWHFGYTRDIECFWRKRDGIHVDSTPKLKHAPKEKQYIPVRIPFRDWRSMK